MSVSAWDLAPACILMGHRLGRIWGWPFGISHATPDTGNFPGESVLNFVIKPSYAGESSSQICLKQPVITSKLWKTVCSTI